MNKRYIALIAAVGIAIGWITLGGTQASTPRHINH